MRLLDHFGACVPRRLLDEARAATRRQKAVADDLSRSAAALRDRLALLEEIPSGEGAADRSCTECPALLQRAHAAEVRANLLASGARPSLYRPTFWWTRYRDEVDRAERAEGLLREHGLGHLLDAGDVCPDDPDGQHHVGCGCDADETAEAVA